MTANRSIRMVTSFLRSYFNAGNNSENRICGRIGGPSDISRIVNNLAGTFRYSAGTAVDLTGDRHFSAGINNSCQPGLAV
ncbi:MAG: hypothetical protein WAO83_21820 [Fuerstiella sp.]